jgi:DNA gyrase subunit A
LFPCPTPGDNQASASGTFYGKSGTGPGAVDQTWDENLHIVFATQSGIVKKSNLSDYANVRRGGIIAIQIEEGDRLIDAKLTNGNNEIVLITKDGMSLRFHEEQLRDQGRNTMGVKLMDLRNGEKLQAIAPVVSQAEEEAQTAEAQVEKS